MDYIYFYGDYVTYYECLTGDETSGSDYLSGLVEQIQTEIDSIKGQLTEWAGDTSNTYNEISSILVKQFVEIEQDIENALTPACEAMDQLKEKIVDFKDCDEKAVAAKKKYENLKNQNLEQNIVDYTDDSGEKHYKENPEYTNWVSNCDDAKKAYDEAMVKLEAIKKECDDIVDVIQKLEDAIREFDSLSGFSGDVSGLDFAAVTGFGEMTREDKIRYLEGLVQNYKDIYLALNDYYTQTYGQGLSFSREDLVNIHRIFDSFYLYPLTGSTSIMEGVSGFVDVQSVRNLISFCEANNFFEKLIAYSNGASWEESGLASIYAGAFDNPESDFCGALYYNGFTSPDDMEAAVADRMMMYEWTNLDDTGLMFYNKEKGETDADLIRKVLKERLDFVKDGYGELKTAYEEYNTLCEAMSRAKSIYQAAKISLNIAPFERVLDEPGYEAFSQQFDENPNMYNDLTKIQVDSTWSDLIYNSSYDAYMTTEEKKIYYYYKHVLGDDNAAKNYLEAIQNPVSNRYGMDVAYNYVKKQISREGVLAYARSCGYALLSGGGDGVIDFLDGLNAWGNSDKVLFGDQDLVDYVKFYKSQLMTGVIEDIQQNGGINLMKSGLLEEMPMEDFEKLRSQLGSVDRMALDEFYKLGTTAGYMAIPMITAVATQGLLGGSSLSASAIELLSSTVSSTLLGISSGGNAMEYALSNGASTSEAYFYGATVAAWETVSEVGTQKLFDFGGVLPGMNFSNSFVKDVAGEMGQEALQTVGENVTENTFGKRFFDPVTWTAKGVSDDVFESAKQAGILTSFMRGGKAVVNTASNVAANIYENSKALTGDPVATRYVQQQKMGSPLDPSGTNIVMDNNNNMNLDSDTNVQIDQTNTTQAGTDLKVQTVEATGDAGAGAVIVSPEGTTQAGNKTGGKAFNQNVKVAEADGALTAEQEAAEQNYQNALENLNRAEEAFTDLSDEDAKKPGYDQARTNLENAKKSLEDATYAYGAAFNTDSSSDGGPATPGKMKAATKLNTEVDANVIVNQTATTQTGDIANGTVGDLAGNMYSNMTPAEARVEASKLHSELTGIQQEIYKLDNVDEINSKNDIIIFINIYYR